MSVILTGIEMFEEMNSDVTHAHINFCDDADHVIDYDILGIKSFKSVDGLIEKLKDEKCDEKDLTEYSKSLQRTRNATLELAIRIIKEYCEVEE